jgi:hypothetical protein
MNTPMDCSNFPVLTNGVHAHENGVIPGHRDDPSVLQQALNAQQPAVRNVMPLLSMARQIIQFELLACRSLNQLDLQQFHCLFPRTCSSKC